MKTIRVFVPWREGLHARPAARLVQRIRDLRSRVLLRAGQRVADGRSILSVLALCATLNTAIDIEVAGDDEEAALRVVAGLFTDAQARDNAEVAGEPDQSPRPERAFGARTSATSRTGGAG